MGFRDGLKRIWEKLKSFWIANLGRHYKKISAAIGGLLIYAGVSLYFVLSGAVGMKTWLLDLYKVFAGGLFTVLILSMFGKEENNGTEESSE